MINSMLVYSTQVVSTQVIDTQVIVTQAVNTQAVNTQVNSEIIDYKMLYGNNNLQIVSMMNYFKTAFLTNYSNSVDKTAFVKDVIELIRNINLPHNPTSTTLSYINNSLTKFRIFISTLPKPSIVTIARSSADGFTDGSVVEYIQDEVLSVLRERWIVEIEKDY
jgi:hypothetical protein